MSTPQRTAHPIVPNPDYPCAKPPRMVRILHAEEHTRLGLPTDGGRYVWAIDDHGTAFQFLAHSLAVSQA